MSNYFYYPLYNSVTTTSNTHKHYPHHHHHHRLLYWVACVVIAIQLQILFWLTLNIEKSQTVLPTPQQGQLFFLSSVSSAIPPIQRRNTDISLPKYITRNTHICVCAPILYVRHTIRVTYISHANFKRQKKLREQFEGLYLSPNKLKHYYE